MEYSGIVQRHTRNGTKFGYPTANIASPSKDIMGLFLGYTSLLGSNDSAVKTAFNAKELPSLIFIGVAETLNQKEHRIESHILDFPKLDLYGSKIMIKVLHKLRESWSLDSEDELIKQMKIDEANARAWFVQNQPIRNKNN